VAVGESLRVMMTMMMMTRMMMMMMLTSDVSKVIQCVLSPQGNEESGPIIGRVIIHGLHKV